MQRPRTQYALSRNTAGDDVRIAWQQFGAGDDVMVVHGFVSHLDVEWDLPQAHDFLESMGAFARVTQFDKRGVGLSDRTEQAPTLEERVDDMLAVLDAAGVEQATIFGWSEGVPLSILFAAAHPERVRALFLWGGMARTSEAPGYPFAPPKEALIASGFELLLPHWDTPVLLDIMCPSLADDPVVQDHWLRRDQAATSPSMLLQLVTMALDFDVRAILPTIEVPTVIMHRRGDRAVPVQGARWMAEQIPTAQYLELEGIDHAIYAGDTRPILQEMERLVTGTVAAKVPERALMTVLFTDICGSTQKATAMGDTAWRAILARHDEIVTEVVLAHRGVIRKDLGDGFLATFDGPARAARAGLAAVAAVAPLGLTLRVGLHCGEVELMGDDVAGIAVHLAARVVDRCDDGQVVSTSTVADLVAGSGLVFDDLGEHDLKGMDRAWRLFSVSDPAEAA